MPRRVRCGRNTLRKHLHKVVQEEKEVGRWVRRVCLPCKADTCERRGKGERWGRKSLRPQGRTKRA